MSDLLLQRDARVRGVGVSLEADKGGNDFRDLHSRCHRSEGDSHQ